MNCEEETTGIWEGAGGRERGKREDAGCSEVVGGIVGGD